MIVTVLVAAGLLGLGFAPSFELFGVEFKSVDILSSLRPVPAEEMPVEYKADFDRLEAELAAVEESADTVSDTPTVTYGIAEGVMFDMPSHVVLIEMVRPDSARKIVPVEDFDTMSVTRFDGFVQKLADGGDVRVAFLGDSFVEGDILTVDLRDLLQRNYGGRGVGFVPCQVPYAIARKSLKSSASGWSTYSLMKPKNVPADVRDNFFISGFLSKGGAGAAARWQPVDMYQTLDSCNMARVLFMSMDSSRVEVVIDDTLHHEIEVPGSDKLRQICVESPLNTLAFNVLEGDVLCYGASFEGHGGVKVDNFSMRSNSGHTIFGTSATVNRQADMLLGYDLVVLQYGLNTMSPDQRNFSNYRKKLCNMIEYAKRCFPDAAVLVLGVSDRWVRNDNGDYLPTGAVSAMTSYQRAAADSCDVAFWNTSEAMAGYGGMKSFVSNGWAASDHTHITYAGGQRVAESLVDAINVRVYEVLVARERADSDAVQELVDECVATSVEVADSARLNVPLNNPSVK